MKTISWIVILFVCILVGSVHSAVGQTSNLEGEWVNVDTGTRSLTRLVVSKAGKAWGIEAWGKCHPTDCVWGATVLTPVGSSVEDFSFTRGFAVWNAGFATKYVTLTLNEGRMTVETVTIFRDPSGRANTRNAEGFQRADERGVGQRINGVSTI
ncbi:MAG: hypothetical protein ACJ72Z_08715, partial [Pyrinomonadaceae bacterium]